MVTLMGTVTVEATMETIMVAVTEETLMEETMEALKKVMVDPMDMEDLMAMETWVDMVMTVAID